MRVEELTLEEMDNICDKMKEKYPKIGERCVNCQLSLSPYCLRNIKRNIKHDREEIIRTEKIEDLPLYFFDEMRDSIMRYNKGRKREITLNMEEEPCHINKKD